MPLRAIINIDMNKPKKTTIANYLRTLKKIKRKVVTSELLASSIGVYPEIIDEHLTYFEPLIAMDPNFNLLNIVPLMEEYLLELDKEKVNVPSQEYATKRKVDEYDSISDFLYKKFTLPGGLLDMRTSLSDVDLKILKKLVHEEEMKRKKKR